MEKKEPCSCKNCEHVTELTFRKTAQPVMLLVKLAHRFFLLNISFSEQFLVEVFIFIHTESL